MHVYSPACRTFMFPQPFDMEITKTPQTVSASFHFRLSAANLQHWNLSTQNMHTHTQTHTPLFSQKGQSLFDPLWGLSPKPKCQHLLLTDSVSSNNPVTVHSLRPGDQQVTAVDLGHNRKSKGYEIYGGIRECQSETRQEASCRNYVHTEVNLNMHLFLSILTICSQKVSFRNQKISESLF